MFPSHDREHRKTQITADVISLKIYSEILSNNKLITIPSNGLYHAQQIKNCMDYAIIKLSKNDWPNHYRKPNIIPLAKELPSDGMNVTITGHYGGVNPVGLYLSRVMKTDCDPMIRLKPLVMPGFSGGGVFDKNETKMYGLVVFTSTPSGLHNSYAIPSYKILENMKSLEMK